MPVPKPPVLSDEPRRITPDQHAMFRLNGHVMTRGLMTTAEAASCRPAVQDMLRRHRGEALKVDDPSGIFSRGYARMTNLWRQDEAFRSFVMAKRFARVAAELLGVPNVRLYHDQVLYKEAGGIAGYWHRDRDGRPIDTDKTITLWMALSDLSVDMGLLMYADGSNRLAVAMPADDGGTIETDAFYKRLIRQEQLIVSRAAGMRAGDASWHAGSVIYASAANLTEKVREVISIIYIADGARVVKPMNKQQEFEWKTWLNQLPAGRLVASELNPLLL